MRINIRYTLTSPLSHIGETASTGAYFNMIKTAEDRLPVVTGNSIRGQIRDAGANELLDRLGVKVDKEIFHVLFSGGNVAATMKDDVGRAAEVREWFPLISLLGGALGTQIMAGKLLCGFAYPICRETEKLLGVNSSISWHDLIDEMEFTRTDDTKNDKLSGLITDPTAESAGQASQQMRYSVQYLAAGTELMQEMILLPGTKPVELGALLSAVEYWWRTAPRLGGMSAKGFGLFDAMMQVDGNDAIRVSKAGVKIAQDVGETIAYYREGTMGSAAHFDLLKAGGKNGKKTDLPD